MKMGRVTEAEILADPALLREALHYTRGRCDHLFRSPPKWIADEVVRGLLPVAIRMVEALDDGADPC